MPDIILIGLFGWACWIMISDMLEDIFNGPHWRDK